MTELLAALGWASVWLAVGVVLLALLRPLLLRLGGAPLVYRAWWVVPLVLLALHLPLPVLPTTVTLPLLAKAGAWAEPAATAATSRVWPALLAALWALGALGVAAVSWRAQRRFERALGTLRRRADGSWQASGDPGLPALVGLWAPRIVVGPGFARDFSPAEQELILRHEESHRRHGDPWANAVLALLRCAFWFHPLLPWAARRFLRDQELACDARTVDPHPALRRLYANALLKAQLVHPVAPMACHWRSQPMLKERIAMLKQQKRKPLTWLGGQVVVVGVCAALVTAAWASQGSAVVAATAQSAVADRDAIAHTLAPPRYPKALVDQGIVGNVVLRVDVDAMGAATDIRVLSATPAGVFDAVVLEAARQWTFEPALKHGKPVASSLKIPVNFAMNEEAPAP